MIPFRTKVLCLFRYGVYEIIHNIVYQSNHFNESMNKNKKENIFLIARNTYFVIGLGYVAYSFIGTLNKVIDDRIVVSMTENEFQRFTFPSITFCYPYNQQVGKDIKNIVKKLQNNPGNIRLKFYTKLAIL